MSADAEFASFQDVEIVKALVKDRSERVEDTRQVAPLTSGVAVWVLSRGNDHRGGLHASLDGGVRMSTDVTRFALKNLIRLRAALDHHNATCGTPARAFLLNPIDHGLMRWEKLWGVPVLPDASIGVKRFRIDCDEYTPSPQPDGELLGVG